MTNSYENGSGSSAAIRGHPLHPFLVPIPIGAVVVAFLSDMAFLQTGASFWAQASGYLSLLALVSGALAAIVGLIDMMGVSRARTMGLAWAHAAGNMLVLALMGVSYIVRIDNPTEGSTPLGVAATSAAFALVLVTGWIGGELTFKHGIGVSRAIGVRGPADTESLPDGRQDVGKS